MNILRAFQVPRVPQENEIRDLKKKHDKNKVYNLLENGNDFSFLLNGELIETFIRFSDKESLEEIYKIGEHYKSITDNIAEIRLGIVRVVPYMEVVIWMAITNKDLLKSFFSDAEYFNYGFIYELEILKLRKLMLHWDSCKNNAEELTKLMKDLNRGETRFQIRDHALYKSFLDILENGQIKYLDRTANSDPDYYDILIQDGSIVGIKK